MTDVHIEVVHSADKYTHHKDYYDCDVGPLAIPGHLKFGAKGEIHKPIENYSHQVDEYSIWLEDEIKAQNMTIMIALDEIYTKAQDAGIILCTRCCPQPYITHAHAIKRQILTLAGLA